MALRAEAQRIWQVAVAMRNAFMPGALTIFDTACNLMVPTSPPEASARPAETRQIPDRHCRPLVLGLPTVIHCIVAASSQMPSVIFGWVWAALALGRLQRVTAAAGRGEETARLLPAPP
jgi:hypothetical protein